MKRSKLHKLDKEKSCNKESDIAIGAEARQKRLKTPTAGNASEDSTKGNSEKDQTEEGNHATGIGSGRNNVVRVEINTDTRMGSTEDG